MGFVCVRGRGWERVSIISPLLFPHKERGHKTIQGRDKESELVLDYLRLSPMIGGGSLLLKASGRERKREREGRHNGEKERQSVEEKTESAEENRPHYWRV